MTKKMLVLAFLIAVVLTLTACAHDPNDKRAFMCQEHGPNWIWADTATGLHGIGELKYACIHFDSAARLRHDPYKPDKN